VTAADRELKAQLKHAPYLSQQMRAEFLAFLIAAKVGAEPRRLTPGTVSTLKGELARLAQSTHPQAQQFAAAMRSRYPEITE
jgi:hypothetical protein